jgi:hypothetical protein
MPLWGAIMTLIRVTLVTNIVPYGWPAFSQRANFAALHLVGQSCSIHEAGVR